MSKPNPDYEGSRHARFVHWVNGEYDPAEGQLETRIPEKKEGEDSAPNFIQLTAEHLSAYDEREFEAGIRKAIGHYRKFYFVVGLLAAAFLVFILLYTVRFLPGFGDPNAPTNNEVSARYIEQGLAETGAVNIVAGMILDYRAFDTFGESCVLFVATCCVLILLRVDRDEEPDSRAAEDMDDLYYEPKYDTILQWSARILVPIIIIFGIYVILNGHISPGGGFSGGAIIGAGLILYLTAFGFDAARRFMNNRTVKILTVGALTFYCIAKSYSFYTGANGLESVITPGTPGMILSAGLIVYLNICVGIVVACTMYTFYVLFRRGGL